MLIVRFQNQYANFLDIRKFKYIYTKSASNGVLFFGFYFSPNPLLDLNILRLISEHIAVRSSAVHSSDDAQSIVNEFEFRLVIPDIRLFTVCFLFYLEFHII